MLADLEPTPDQVTVTVNTSQMNVAEQFDFRDIAGTSMADPDNFAAYSNMIVPSNPSFFEEHVRRLTARGIQSAFQFYNINSFETIERMMRRGVYKGPLVMNWVAISGGMDQANIYNLANMLRAVPDGAVYQESRTVARGTALPSGAKSMAIVLAMTPARIRNAGVSGSDSSIATDGSVVAPDLKTCVYGPVPVTVAGPSSTRARVSRRSTPAVKRDKLSKFSTISEMALSTAAKAPAACTARPTSSSPDSTGPARITLGTTTVSWLNPRWNRLRLRWRRMSWP